MFIRGRKVNNVLWEAKAFSPDAMLISSQAAGSANGTAEGSETMTVSSASNKRSHERPAPGFFQGDDVVRSPGESSGSWFKRPALNVGYPKFLGPSGVSCWETQGELRESFPTTVQGRLPIRSRAPYVTPFGARDGEGSEIRSRAKAVTDPRAPCPLEYFRGDDMIRTSGENLREYGITRNHKENYMDAKNFLIYIR